MELLKPDHYHIPKLVAEKVEPHDAFVFAVVYWFVKMKEGRCYASNERIAQSLPYKSSGDSVGNSLLRLEETGLIERIFSDKSRRNRVEIKCLVEYHVQPTRGTRPTPTLDNVQPVRGQNKNRELDNILVVADAPTETPIKREKKYPHALEVFTWFPHPQPSWRINTTELKHAELLWVRGEAEVKKRLSYLERHAGEDFLPTVLKPSDLERKWLDLSAYAKRNS